MHARQLVFCSLDLLELNEVVVHAFYLPISVQVLDAFPVSGLELAVAVCLRAFLLDLIHDESPIVDLARSSSAFKELRRQLFWPSCSSTVKSLPFGVILFIALTFCLLIDDLLVKYAFEFALNTLVLQVMSRVVWPFGELLESHLVKEPNF